MIGYVHSFPLVVRVFREWFGCLEVVGRSCRTCRIVISSKSMAPGGTFSGEGGRGGKTWTWNAGSSWVCEPNISLTGETMHVIKFGSWFD